MQFPNQKKARQIAGLVNEWYLEDLSDSIRLVLDHKRQAGQFIGSFAPYGYVKSPRDKGKLLPDPEASAHPSSGRRKAAIRRNRVFPAGRYRSFR